MNYQKKMQPKIEKKTIFKCLPPKIKTINFVEDLKKTKYVLYQQKPNEFYN